MMADTSATMSQHLPRWLAVTIEPFEKPHDVFINAVFVFCTSVESRLSRTCARD